MKLMKYGLLFLFLTIVSLRVFSAGSWTSSGSRQETFSQGLKFGTGKYLESKAVNPKVSATDAPQGSIIFNGTGLYRKNDNGSTNNWTDILTDIGGNPFNQSLNTTNSPTFLDLNLDTTGTIASASGAIYFKNQTDVAKKVGSNNPELNILAKYPSFEESVNEPTSSNATITQINSTEGNGLKSLQMVTTASASGSITLDATTSITTPQQGAILAGIKTSSSGVRLITRSNGTNVSTVNIPNDGKFYPYEIPVVCGTTSCGYQILGDNDAEVETVEVAYAYPKLGDVKQSFNESRFVGSLKYSQIASCQWSNAPNASVFTNFSADTDCGAPTVSGNLSAPATKVPGFVIANAPAGTYQIVASTFLYTSGAGYSFWRLNDGTNSTASISTYNQGNSGGHGLIVGTITLNSPQVNWSVNIQSASSNQQIIDLTNVSGDLMFTVYYFPPVNVSTYSQGMMQESQISYSNDAGCDFTMGSGATFTAVNDTGCDFSAANKRGDVQAPTTTGDFAFKKNVKAGKYLISLSGAFLTDSASCGWRVNDGVQSYYPVLISANGASDFSGSGPVVYEYTSDRVVEFKVEVYKASGTSCRVYADTPNYSATISVVPWQNQITGSFANVVTTPGVASPEMFSFSYGTTNATTVCSASPCSYLDQIGEKVSSVTRSSTGTYVANFTKTYTKLKCGVGGISTTGDNARFTSPLRCESCNTLSFLTENAAGTDQDTYGTFTCMGY